MLCSEQEHQLRTSGRRDAAAVFQQLPAAGQPAVAGERADVAAVPAVHRWRRRQRELLPDLTEPRQPDRAVPERSRHSRCCAVLLPERLVHDPELAGRDLRVRRRAVQLDRDLRARVEQLQQHHERWRLDTVHRHDLHAWPGLDDQRREPLAAGRPGCCRSAAARLRTARQSSARARSCIA